jgi:hypothetical protein
VIENRWLIDGPHFDYAGTRAELSMGKFARPRRYHEVGPACARTQAYDPANTVVEIGEHWACQKLDEGNPLSTSLWFRNHSIEEFVMLARYLGKNPVVILWMIRWRPPGQPWRKQRVLTCAETSWQTRGEIVRGGVTGRALRHGEPGCWSIVIRMRAFICDAVFTV